MRPPSVFHQRPHWTGVAIIVPCSADEDLHRHAAEKPRPCRLPRLFGRVTYEMMEAAWRPVGADRNEGLIGWNPSPRAIKRGQEVRRVERPLVSSTARQPGRQVRFNASGNGVEDVVLQPSRRYGTRVPQSEGLVGSAVNLSDAAVVVEHRVSPPGAFSEISCCPFR